MKLLACALNDLPEFRQLLTAIDGGACPAAVSGLAAVHRAHFAAALRQDTKRPLVLVCPDDAEARRAAGEVCAAQIRAMGLQAVLTAFREEERDGKCWF